MNLDEFDRLVTKFANLTFKSASTTDDIIYGMAKALFATAWTDYMEENHPGKLSGKDVFDEMPDVPPDALHKAHELAAKIEALNNKSLVDLVHEASEADGAHVDSADFGHYLAMQSLGTGVSWFDNHAGFVLKLPYFEYHWYPDEQDDVWN